MWRAFGSLLLTFAALAWAIISLAVCFFYAAAFWRDHFGGSGSFYAAFLSFGVCLISARYMLRVADRMVEPYSGPFSGSVYDAAPRETFYHDWRRYAQDIARSRRYAFYSRTRQWEKLAALEAEIKASAAEVVVPEEPSVPRRTTMGDLVTPEERRRGARRASREAAAAAVSRDWKYPQDSE